MSTAHETILASLPGSQDGERILLVLKDQAGVASRVEMRQQTYCERFGWYTQSSIEMEPQQVASLRNALGQSTAASSPSLDGRFSRLAQRRGFEPRVVRADSA